jgi:phosphatidylserine decarboxylase
MRRTLFFNRYTKAVEEEAVFGERWLRFAYGTVFGKLTVVLLLKRKLFSAIVGGWASSGRSVGRIRPFIDKYGLRADSFEKKVDDFSSFNDFFTRKLKPSARPIATRENSVGSPVDGRHLAYDYIADLSPFFIKGERISVGELIADDALARKFSDGGMLISRLCPSDYHRFHFPVACTPEKTFLMDGCLGSIHPLAMGGMVDTYLKNRRMSTLLHSDSCGDILMVEIGATGVGSIRQTFATHKQTLKGAEKGYFELGGSTVILIFEHGRVQFSEDILENTAKGIETYVLMGDEIGTINSQP